jgi:hypothetical protein
MGDYHDEATVERIGRAISLGEQFQGAVARTAEEFEKIPAFIRPFAEKRFRDKTGRSIEEWAHSANDLVEQLEKMAAADAAAWAEFRGYYPRLRELLVQLGDYCRAVPGELALFTRDAEKLRKVQQVMDEREALLRSLVAALDEL